MSVDCIPSNTFKAFKVSNNVNYSPEQKVLMSSVKESLLNDSIAIDRKGRTFLHKMEAKGYDFLFGNGNTKDEISIIAGTVENSDDKKIFLELYNFGSYSKDDLNNLSAKLNKLKKSKDKNSFWNTLLSIGIIGALVALFIFAAALNSGK